MEPVQLAAILAGAALVASMISVEVGISVALIELALGVVLGNIFSLDPNQSWLVFIASFASVVLTFLAGAEVDPDDFRERFWPAVGIGLVSFAGPFVVRDRDRARPAGLDNQGVTDRRDRALDHEPRGRLRGAGRNRAEHRAGRQADHERLLRD